MYNESVQVVLLLAMQEYIIKRHNPYTLGDILHAQIIQQQIDKVLSYVL